jgi:hypothetical protein
MRWEGGKHHGGRQGGQKIFAETLVASLLLL